jgi:putative peptide zinc metalloprotease protein
MSASVQSSLWYRVAALKPQLLARAKLHRHRYRGQLWYLLQDPASGRIHRFTPATRLVLAAMDGRRSVQELWQLARAHLGDDAPTQDELIQLLGQLHASDLLASDVPPDALELFDRGAKADRAKRRRSWMNPMAVRFPLWNPGAFLDRHAALWRCAWSRAGALVWFAVVLPALALLPARWPELTHNLSDRVLQADNLLLIVLVFPLIKFLHEMGHATATRAGGGEVHDMGVMLLVLMPVPYVDASSATVLRSRWHRALVGAAGMVVEVFLAALAFYLWLAVEPGIVRAVCFNVMLVAGVSTLIFNGNPLLRYDAYYILADLIEMPNLAQRAARYWGYLAERYLLRSRDLEWPADSRGERAWLGFYGLASTLYRLVVTFAIAIFVASRFFFIGVVLALWAMAMMAVVPLVRAAAQIDKRPGLRERRTRIVAGAAAAGALLAALVLWLPLPYRTQAEGVVWLPEQAALRAGAQGFVSRLVVPPGEAVWPGMTLVRSVDPALDAQLRLLKARVAELEAIHANEFVTDRARAQIVREQLQHERDALHRARERAAGLVVSARSDGIFTVARPADLPGRHHKQGEVLGYVLAPGQTRPVVRVLVEQTEIDGVAVSVRGVGLRLGDDLSRVIPGRVLRQVPAGTDEAPSRALLASGGGRLAADPRDPQGRKMLARVFELDVEPLEPLAAAGQPIAYGQRVHVRFALEPTPLATQAWRALRRLFLTHFDV